MAGKNLVSFFEHFNTRTPSVRIPQVIKKGKGIIPSEVEEPISIHLVPLSLNPIGHAERHWELYRNLPIFQLMQVFASPLQVLQLVSQIEHILPFSKYPSGQEVRQELLKKYLKELAGSQVKQ